MKSNITIKDVLSFIQGSQMSSSDRNQIVAALKRQFKTERAIAKSVFHVGQRVSWADKYCAPHIGTIQKINSVNITIVETGTGTRWRVSPNFLKSYA